MTNAFLAAAVGLALAEVGAPVRTQGVGQGQRVVWQWFAPCPASRVVDVEVRFRGKPVHATSFPACSMPFANIPAEPRKTLAFKFRARASRFGSEFSAFGVQEVEANIWRAGGEADGIVLGVSVMVPRQVLLNTLHFASATQRSETPLADVLVIITSAVHEAGDRASQ